MELFDVDFGEGSAPGPSSVPHRRCEGTGGLWGFRYRYPYEEAPGWPFVPLASWLSDFFLDLLSTGGYPLLFVLMVFDSLPTPVPGEAIMPFAGFLVVQGELSVPGVIIVGMAGSMLGSLSGYWLGRYAGRAAVIRWGRYVLLGERDLAWAERWFSRFGAYAILLSRLTPVVRSVISIPAGVGRMRLDHFLISTAAGAFAWTLLMLSLGMALETRWDAVVDFLDTFEIPIIAGLVGIIVWYYVWGRRRATTGPAAVDPPRKP